MTKPFDAAPTTVEVLAPAKINLYLHIVGRRADGFHLLDSLVAFVDVGDLVTVAGRTTADAGDARRRVAIHRHGPFAKELPADPDDDLSTRAVAAFAEYFGQPIGGVTVGLHKRLPVAAGIGGGSADAAAILRALAVLSGGADAAGLHEAALSLGADVPVCLAAAPSLMRGIGDELRPVGALPEMGIVMTHPRRPLSTPEVFARYAEQSPEYRVPMDIAADTLNDEGGLQALLERTHNDLTQPATAALPVIGEVLRVLDEQPDCRLARMSGSGATCFGLFATPSLAASVCRRLATSHRDWWWAAGRLLSHPPEPKLLRP